MRHYIPLVALAALAACGTRGNLTLPPGPAPAPIFGNPAPAKPLPKPQPPAADASRGDLNTAADAAK
ncbi:hypothetical protein [Azospira restricta]|uniref:hypothetical protein n=1 Tax=Azospira restricta TaxID=404405 RepID=UPI00361518B7